MVVGISRNSSHLTWSYQVINPFLSYQEKYFGTNAGTKRLSNFLFISFSTNNVIPLPFSSMNQL